MEENKLLKSELSRNGFSLYSINLNSKELKDKRGYGIIQYQWFDKGSFKVVVRTGLKKDVIVSDDYNENYKRLLLKSVVNKRIPFFISKNELEGVKSSTSIYGFMYSLREQELKKIGTEGIRFGIWPSDKTSYELDTKSVIECNFLYSEKKGTFFSGVNNVEFFLPKGESLRYYSKHMDRQTYFSLLKSLRLVLNLVIINLRSITVESLVELSKSDKKVLIKRLMILEWLLVTKINGLLGLLDNDSWAWRYNFYYLQSYITELLVYLRGIKTFLLSLYRLNLSTKESKLLVYRIQDLEIKNLESLSSINYSKNLAQLYNEVNLNNLNQNLFIGVLNHVLKGYLVKELFETSNSLEVSKRNKLTKLHLVSSLDHFFKKSVVSVRSLQKLHKKIWRITKVRAIKGLIFQNVPKSRKDFYSVIGGVKSKPLKKQVVKRKRNVSFENQTSQIKPNMEQKTRSYKGNLRVVKLKKKD